MENRGSTLDIEREVRLIIVALQDGAARTSDRLSTKRLYLVKQAAQRKICARLGCDTLVKKPTAKYCSIRCCALDPARQERLRVRARRAPIVPMAHQLSIVFQVHSDFESSLDNRFQEREGIPAGL